MTDTATPKRRPRRARNGVVLLKTLELPSGGTLTLSGRFDIFKLSPPDRGFVFALCDFLEQRADRLLPADDAELRPHRFGTAPQP